MVTLKYYVDSIMQNLKWPPPSLLIEIRHTILKKMQERIKNYINSFKQKIKSRYFTIMGRNFILLGSKK